MATPQSAILPDGMNSCIVIEAQIELLAVVKKSILKALELLAQMQEENPHYHVCMAIGFGHDVWQKLKHGNEGSEIKNFVPLGSGLAPSTQADLCIHIQSLDFGTNILLARKILKEFGFSIKVIDETHGYKLPEERGHEGFVDGTENPKGHKLRKGFGVIADECEDAGGSYLLIQKYIHDLDAWNSVTKYQQSAIIGRTKNDNIEIPNEHKPPLSHVARVDITENGVGLKMIRQSLPFGKVSGDSGLIFIAYCFTLYNIERQLHNMFGETDGQRDLMLRFFTKPVTGSYYFVPSLERLQDLN